MMNSLQVSRSREEGDPVRSLMTLSSQSRSDATKQNYLFSPRTKTVFGTWNVRTMYETGKSVQVARELRNYSIDVLGLCETHWIQSGRTMLSTGEHILYSGHEDENARHSEGVGFMLSKKASKSLVQWEPVSPRIITARFNSRDFKVTFIQCYAPTNEQDEERKAEFYNQLQNVLDRQKKKDMLIVLGDFNAKIGSVNMGRDRVMGRYGLGTMNENGELFADFCAFNGLVIGGSIFPHKRIHKVTWVSPNRTTENQIDHICIGKRFRRSLLDVRAYRGADVSSDHHLVIGKVKLKLKNYASGKEKTGARYDINQLNDGEMRNKFNVACSNRFDVLSSLIDGDMEPTNVEDMWKDIKDVWLDSCEEVIGRPTNKQMEWVTKDSLLAIEKRRNAKAGVNRAKTTESKVEAIQEYSAADRDVKRSIRKDKRHFFDELSCKAEAAAGKCNMKELYDITRKLSGKKQRSEKPVKEKDGRLLAKDEDQLRRWAEHFQEILNRPQPSDMPDIPPAEKPLTVNLNRPSRTEIRKAIKALKNNKAPGPDGVPAEALKASIQVSTEMLYELFGKIWISEVVPKDWTCSHIVKLPKKGTLDQCKNYRGISLLSVPGKVLSRIMLDRLKIELDKQLREEQAGFRSERSCTDQIATLRIIIEQSLEWNSPLYVNFIDFEKAFDSVNREFLWKVMRHYGIPEKFVMIIKNMYDQAQSRVIHNGQLSEPFNISTGVRQGCLLSPVLFLLVLDWIMRKTTANKNYGIQWTLTSQLNDLDFADDIALVSHNRTQMQQKTKLMASTASSAGLYINTEKTKTLRINTVCQESILVNDKQIENVDNFVYLGSVVTVDGGADQDILARVGKARTAFMMLKNIWSAKYISLKTKLKIFNSNVKSVLLYGCETWRATKRNMQHLQVFINKCLRRILGIRWPDRIRNEELWRRTGQDPIQMDMTKRKWGWLGHTLRKPPPSVARHVIRWNPQGHRKRGRPRNSWRRTLETEAAQRGHSMASLERAAANRVRWRAIIDDLCSQWRERD